MSSLPRIYWDSCTWIGLINQETDKFIPCKYIFERAEKGEIEILASTFVLAEVYKTRCDDPYSKMPEEHDEIFELFFRKEYIIKAEVNEDVAICARRLLRHFGELKKPQDAIHLATALLYNADEFHTFDGSDLLPLSEKIERMDGTILKICVPPPPPADYEYKDSLLRVTAGSDNPIQESTAPSQPVRDEEKSNN